MKISRAVAGIVRQALKEDGARSDVTSRLSIPYNIKVRAVIKANQAGIVCGLDLAGLAFRMLDRAVVFKKRRKDGMPVKKGDIIAEISGRARNILSAERVALNFISRLSGIASQAGRFVRQARPFKTRILDTRKTSPNLRVLEKYAVRTGGGRNHRFNLSDMVLLKENHIRALGDKRGLRDLVGRIRKRVPPGMKIEVEAQSLPEFRAALDSGCDIIMLDNMGFSELKKAVALAKNKRVLLEVSGGIGLGKVRKAASLGVDFISSSKLTCGVEHLDVSLDII
ncbi:MAG: carboxylating nicotinate-nucleotide diphosphorylase [Candidatus Omnitrophica bacterium]|nr:carboxylating nicotinate-nucleotide diphosphorylase [Candidatus Omnitrophota bacterium]